MLKKEKYWYILSAIIVFVLIVVAAIVIIVITNKNKEKEEDTGSELIFTVFQEGAILYSHKDKYSPVITIPSEVEIDGKVYPVTTISEGAFSMCTKLTDVVIPVSVKTIGDGAFSQCSKLVNITISEGVKSIGSYAFYGCFSLKNVEIPSSVEVIKDHAFLACSGINKMTLPFIGESLTTTNTYLGYLFGASSYEGNNEYVPVALKEIVLQDTCKKINSNALYGCDRLERIIIPSSVEEIGKNAFSGCTNLTIYSMAEQQPSGWNSEFNPDERPVEWSYKKQN